MNYPDNWVGFNGFSGLGFSLELLTLINYGVIHQMVWFVLLLRRNVLVMV
jgi:hypothetical protein